MDHWYSQAASGETVLYTNWNELKEELHTSTGLSGSALRTSPGPKAQQITFDNGAAGVYFEDENHKLYRTGDSIELLNGDSNIYIDPHNFLVIQCANSTKALWSGSGLYIGGEVNASYPLHVGDAKGMYSTVVSSASLKTTNAFVTSISGTTGKFTSAISSSRVKTPYYTNIYHPTDYIIYKDGDNTVAIRGSDAHPVSISTDATTVFTSVIGSLHNYIGKIYVHSGTYSIASIPAYLTSGLIIEGSGWDLDGGNQFKGTVLQISDGGEIGIQASGSRKLVLRDIAIRGESDNTGWGVVGGSPGRTANWLLENVGFGYLEYGYADDERCGNGLYDSKFLECYFYSCSLAGVYTRECENSYDRCTFRVCNKGIRFDGVTFVNAGFYNTVFTGCDYDIVPALSNATYGFNCYNCWFEREGQKSLWKDGQIGYVVSGEYTNPIGGMNFDGCYFSPSSQIPTNWIQEGSKSRLRFTNCHFRQWDDWTTYFPNIADCKVYNCTRNATDGSLFNYSGNTENIKRIDYLDSLHFKDNGDLTRIYYNAEHLIAEVQGSLYLNPTLYTVFKNGNDEIFGLIGGDVDKGGIGGFYLGGGEQPPDYRLEVSGTVWAHNVSSQKIHIEPTTTEPDKLAGTIWCSGNTTYTDLYLCSSNGGTWTSLSASGAGGGGNGDGASNLSELTIDDHKDWNSKGIYNLAYISAYTISGSIDMTGFVASSIALEKFYPSTLGKGISSQVLSLTNFSSNAKSLYAGSSNVNVSYLDNVSSNVISAYNWFDESSSRISEFVASGDEYSKAYASAQIAVYGVAPSAPGGGLTAIIGSDFTYGASGLAFVSSQAISGGTYTNLYLPADYIVYSSNGYHARDFTGTYTNYSDDSADVVINEAIGTLSGDEGGKVYLTNGKYKISDTIIMSSNIHLQGAGIGATVLDMQGSISDGCITLGGSGTEPKKYITISDLTIDGNWDIDTTGMMIFFHNDTPNSEYVTLQNLRLQSGSTAGLKFGNTGGDHHKHITVDNVYVQVSSQASNNAIGIDYCDDITLNNIQCRANKACGIDITDANNITCNNFLISGSATGIKIAAESINRHINLSNFIINNITAGNGVRIESCHDVSLSNFDIYNVESTTGVDIYSTVNELLLNNIKISGTASRGIIITGKDVTLNNAIIQNTHSIGIELKGDNIDISNTIIKNGGTWCNGVVVNGGDNISLSNSIIKDVTRSGVALLDGHNFTINNCQLYNNKAGICAPNGFSNLTITNNLISSNTVDGIVLDNNTDVIILGNRLEGGDSISNLDTCSRYKVDYNIGYSNVQTKTANYTANAGEYVLASNEIDIKLPATHYAGDMINVKNVGTDTVTVSGQNGDTIDGDVTYDMYYQYESVSVISDGSNWYLM